MHVSGARLFSAQDLQSKGSGQKNGPGVPPSAVNLPVRLGCGYPMIHFRECGATTNVSVKSMYSCSRCNPSSVSHWLLFIKYEKENKTACIENNGCDADRKGPFQSRNPHVRAEDKGFSPAFYVHHTYCCFSNHLSLLLLYFVLKVYPHFSFLASIITTKNQKR